MSAIPATIGELIAGAPAERPAFEAPGRESLTYGELAQFVARIAGQLRQATGQGCAQQERNQYSVHSRYLLVCTFSFRLCG